MLANFNLTQLFSFPLQDDPARKNFLITSLVYLTAFVIPIVPLIVIMGYTARIMRQIVNGEAPHMPAWDDFETIFKDGLYLFGVRIVYMLPLFIVFFPLFFGMATLPIWLQSSSNSDQLALLIPLLFGLAMLLFVPLTLALGLAVPVAETHAIVHNEFAAAFRIREWWPILRSNWAGFLLAFLISYLASMVLSALVGFAVITIVLICLLPLLMPGIYAYLTLIMYALFAQAYKDGREKSSVQPQQTTTEN